ncbi:MAG: ribonuclease R [Vicinamibacteria bacterium]|nr:ribonuclease R [Vicinamibacteria bacterium]
MLSREQVLRQIRESVHHPATSRELLQVLRVPRHERPTFRRLLKALVSDGELLQIRGNRFGLADHMDVVVGRLQMHHAGYGFVVADVDRDGGDLYIAPTNVKEALHGDRVVARIEDQRGDRAEGRIIRVLERANATLVGRLEIDDASLAFVVPFDRRVLADVQVPPEETRDAEAGDMVVVELTRWPTATRPPLGRVIEVLGPIDTPGVDTRIIIRKHSLPDVHGDEAIAEATALGTSVRPDDLDGRTDFRSRQTVTIDGEHARDFDDAITLERLANGHYWLGVHIADVSHYVEEGCALDAEAYERGTSVYFPERAIHMFPAELATGLCSLKPHVDRLVQSCLMEVNRNGDVVRVEFHDGVINSDERMTYTDVNAILTAGDVATRTRYAPLLPFFELTHELFGILNGRRRRRGSVDFDLPQADVLMDESGRIENIIVAERNVAHRIIEEFMLLANETVADSIEARGGPGLYRIHEEPDLLKVEQFEEFISGFGHSLSAPLNALRPRHFQRLIEKISGTPEERPIAFLMLRTMQKARYAPENLGHFGLAASSYTHFTSPIRRYPDLVVHRLLRAHRHDGIDETRREEIDEELPEVARHTSERERRADDAERELLQWRKVRFMADKVGDEFDGYITGVATFGLFIELVEHFVEGLVHISSMANDYYRYLESSHTLHGENTHKVYRLGDKVRVQVIRVDLEHRQIDLGLTEILDVIREDENRRGPRKSKATPKAEQRRAKSPSRPGKRERAASKATRGRGRK